MRLAIALFLLVIVFAIECSAGEYDPPGLYDVDYFKLDNGLDVILRQRTQVHSVSIRLVVNVGMRNFPCDKRETPHFLEHLLFMGTSEHSEAELARLIQDHGGNWNAYTSSTETGYQIDIYDRELPLAIDTLYEIMTDTMITPQTNESARAVIHREHSGKLSRMLQWAYSYGLFKGAGAKAAEVLLPGTGVACPGVMSPEGIEESDVKAAYRNFYVPSNMTLVVVGNFERAALVPHIRASFGQMAPEPMNGAKIVTPPYMTGSTQVTGTLSPLVGANGTIGFAYRTEGLTSNLADYYALWVTWRYLERVLYEKIRVEKALSYSPGSYFSAEPDCGAFAVAADVDLDKMGTVKSLLEQELENLRQGRIRTDDVAHAKRRILLERLQSYESNGSAAAYYVASRYQLPTSGKLTNHEAAIESVTPADIKRVANKYLRTDREVLIWSTPTFTYGQFIFVLVVLVLGVPGVGFYLIRRLICRRRKAVQRGAQAESSSIREKKLS
jgi:predicted Zn-dependent peptidase